MNQITATGNLVSDPEERDSKGTTVVKFRIGSRRNFGGKKGDDTNFFNVVCFGQTADVVLKYLKKGDRVVVGGTLNIDNYEDKNGDKKQWVEINANNVELPPKSRDDDDDDDDDRGRRGKSSSSSSRRRRDDDDDDDDRGRGRGKSSSKRRGRDDDDDDDDDPFSDD